MSAPVSLPSLGIVGAGAFGRFMARHLVPHFDLVLADPRADLDAIAGRLGARAGTLDEAAAAGITILAVPVQAIGEVAHALATRLPAGALVLDVGSVKVKPARLLAEALPETVDIVCTHPLFGPQSAADTIAGRKITLCPVRGDRADGVARFCGDVLGLKVIEATPADHDRELAYVQGVTHLIGKTLLTMALDDFDQTTVSYDLLRRAVGYIADDSADLFRAIELENPFAPEARRAFFDAVRQVESVLEDAEHRPGEAAP
ncbi:prephenate dehydrogenase [Rhodothalassium salexigens DSM 2132]|uniref:Prephenate dehydrogenase n=1 Tax=Rhodothalassium salexigens DSM 2132 TaxID=1188247 RepID=A0A4R2PW20_RHOSA|nr:prephenate dehydrogenase/arogenate dehydrogenase family protein [Rhodothalassium salexigens]MBB4210261.1 prephenate dehydrogenase [Rhodothalassium salexigens DSM 2132]MBK1638781.1 hypothetical protein [Rhodothalassium salexigens DSM 2132]TCP38425.1 prephenate dehydrogenase [Rhodothalassium salexigens DSM 2132]